MSIYRPGPDEVFTAAGILARDKLQKREFTREDARATYYICEWRLKGTLVRRDVLVNMKQGLTVTMEA